MAISAFLSHLVIIVAVVMMGYGSEWGVTSVSFVYNRFEDEDPTLLLLQNSSLADGKIQMIMTGMTYQMGRFLHSTPVNFSDGARTTGTASFSTTFVFSIQPGRQGLAHGITFLIAPDTNPVLNSDSGYLGAFNASLTAMSLLSLSSSPSPSPSSSSRSTLAIEYDVYFNPEFNDTNDNHVGVDIGSVFSVAAANAAVLTSPVYRNSSDGFNLNLKSGQLIQSWIDYNGDTNLLEIYVSNSLGQKPTYPFFSDNSIALSGVLYGEMYTGFSASSGSLETDIFTYIYTWSFSNEGTALEPMIPSTDTSDSGVLVPALVSVFVILAIGLMLCALAIALHRRWKQKRETMEFDGGLIDMEEMELGTGTVPRRFKYKELSEATNGFSEKQILGRGGFGAVYRGSLPGEQHIAVKRMSKQSQQGMKEFIAEVRIIGRLRHRNLVSLLGWCPEKGLSLVYEHMPNGSLDKHLFQWDTGKCASQSNSGADAVVLTWEMRCTILQGVAAALVYLHEEWEQKVIHRDVKASNVLLDGDLNARLGDFGLARLYNHGSALPDNTTNVAGTFGYLAPEYVLTRKATEKGDVYSFGALALEVGSGQRASRPPPGIKNLDKTMVDWVWELHESGKLEEAIDPRLQDGESTSITDVLRLGLLCLHPDPACRPTMRRALQFLLGDAVLPAVPTSRPTMVTYHFTSISADKSNTFSSSPTKDTEDLSR